MYPSAWDLHYFLEVATTKNISRASERLGLSQPSLSLAIQRLEENLGVPLLVRSRSGVALTKAGLKFQSQARKLLDAWGCIKEEAARDEIQVRGRYLVGMHVSVALISANAAIAALLHEYPQIEFALHHDLSRKITQKVVSLELDFGVVVNPISHPELVIRELYKDEVGFWTSEEPSGHQDISTQECILICDPDLGQTRALLKCLRAQKIEPGRMIATSSLEVIADLVSQGAGIGILPRRVATRFKEQNLVELDTSWPTYHDVHCLVYRADLQTSQAAKSLARSIERTIKGFMPVGHPQSHQMYS